MCYFIDTAIILLNAILPLKIFSYPSGTFIIRETAMVLFRALLILVLSCASVRASRLLNITHLENCQEFENDAVVVLQTINYHVDPETGLIDTVHGDFRVKAGDRKRRVITITLFKCADTASDEKCMSNPTDHVEVLGCDRLQNDDSGPWAMFGKAIAGANCGTQPGVFSLEYSSLKLKNLIKYLDIHDEDFGRFRLRMYFHSTQTQSIRACLDLDFKLVNV